MPPVSTFTGIFSELIQPIQVFFHFYCQVFVKWQYSTTATAPPQKSTYKALGTLAKIKKYKKAKKHLTKPLRFAIVAPLAHLRGWAGTM